MFFFFLFNPIRFSSLWTLLHQRTPTSTTFLLTFFILRDPTPLRNTLSPLHSFTLSPSGFILTVTPLCPLPVQLLPRYHHSLHTERFLPLCLTLLSAPLLPLSFNSTPVEGGRAPVRKPRRSQAPTRFRRVQSRHSGVVFTCDRKLDTSVSTTKGRTHVRRGERKRRVDRTRFMFRFREFSYDRKVDT